MGSPHSDDKLVPGARRGTVGVYDRPPAWRRWLPHIIAVALSIVASVVLLLMLD